MIEEKIKKILDANFELKLTYDFILLKRKQKRLIWFSKVRKEFKLSKTTARKRINNLLNLKLIEIRRYGRKKIIFLIGEKQEIKEQYYISIDEDLAKEANKKALKNDISLSYIIEKKLNEWVKEK